MRETRGSSFVQIMFLVAFGENWAGMFANLVHAVLKFKNQQMTKQRIGCIKRKKTIEFTPLFLNVYVHVFWLFCVTMMALQVNLL